MATTEEILPKQRFIESSCLFTNLENARPMSNFRTSNSDFMDAITGRSACPLCYKSRRYFCYTCCVPLENIKDKIPNMKLPVDIDIIKHPLEVDGKSTAIHAAVLAPDCVKIHMYPNIPDYGNLRVALVFPSSDSVTLKELWRSKTFENDQVPCTCFENKSAKKKENCIINFSEQILSNSFHCRPPFDRIVFIDSTWRQTRRILADERLNDLPCISLISHKSLFWRHQRNKPMSYLATIEAVYYFLVELEGLQHPLRSYDGRYDDILFFFKYMYQKIRCVYDPRITQLLAEGALQQQQQHQPS